MTCIFYVGVAGGQVLEKRIITQRSIDEYIRLSKLQWLQQ